MKHLISIFCSLLLLQIVSSCVPSRKFDAEVSARKDAELQAKSALDQLKVCDEKINNIKAAKDKIAEELAELNKDHDVLSTRYDQQLRLNKDLQELYDKLLEVNEKLTAEAAGKSRALSEELTRKEAELLRKEQDLRNKELELENLKLKLENERKAIEALQKDVEALQNSLAAREARVKELEEAIAARDAKTQALREKLNQALLGFKSDDLSVEIRDGKVYVSLSQNLLFAPGSSKLDAKGADAISKLSKVLNNNVDIDVLVEGHTDADGDAKSNWKLSTDRSLTIVDNLIKNQVEPKRITAAGRGEHVPVASNEDESGKAKNRRTDIILSPKLDEIMNILDN